MRTRHYLLAMDALTLLAASADVSRAVTKKQVDAKLVFEGNNCNGLEAIVAVQKQRERNIALDKERKEAARLRKEQS